MTKVERAALEAVFHLQLNTTRAVRYIQEQAACTENQAAAAVKQVATSYKTK